MRHVSKLLCILVLLTGCVSVTRGLQTVQTGLAIADVATDKIVDQFIANVAKVREACELTSDADACMDKLGLGQKTLDAICLPGTAPDDPPCIGGAAVQLDAAYGQAVQAVQSATQAWAAIQPHLDAAKAAAKKVGDGLAR